MFTHAKPGRTNKFGRSDDLVHSEGWIFKGTRHSEVKNLYLSPIIRHFRPLSPAFGVISAERLRIISHDAAVNGVPCVLLEENWGDGHRVGRYWVAPGRDMAILRHDRRSDGIREVQVEAQFHRNAIHGWLPTRWSAVQFSAGDKILFSETLVVTACDVNISVSPETFDIVFPPGTKLYDRIEKKTYVVQSNDVKISSRIGKFAEK